MNTLDASKADFTKKTISNIGNLATIIIVAVVDVALAWLHLSCLAWVTFP